MKAFDSVYRQRMFMILRAYGVPDAVVWQVAAMYEDTTAFVRTSSGESSDPFDVNVGVLQGDTLAPLLFVLVVDYVLRCAVEDTGIAFELRARRSSRQPATVLSDLDFADDIVLFANNTADAQRFLHSVEQHAADVGLFINAKKTEYMVVGRDAHIATSKMCFPLR